MSTNRFLILALAGWSVAIAASFSARMVLIASALSPVEGVAWLVGTVGPMVLLASIVRGASSRTIAQVLYDTEHPVTIASTSAPVETPRDPRS